MCGKLREKAEKTVVLSEFGKKTIKCQCIASRAVYLTDAANVLKEQTLEAQDEEYIHSFQSGQDFLHIANAKISTNACSPVDIFIKCGKDIYVS